MNKWGLRPEDRCGALTWWVLLGLLVFLLINYGSNGLEGAEVITTDSSRSRDILALREACVEDLEIARKSPLCRPFLPPAIEDVEAGVGQEPELCDPEGGSCQCVQGGIDLLCRYKICGFEGGHYTHPGLVFLADTIKKDLESRTVDSKELRFSAFFVGNADGLQWLQGEVPRPQPIPLKLEACLKRARQNYEGTAGTTHRFDPRDVDVAFLRGCALEEAFRGVLQNFALDLPPTFTVRALVAGAVGKEHRSAELEIVIPDVCKETRR